MKDRELINQLIGDAYSAVRLVALELESIRRLAPKLDLLELATDNVAVMEQVAPHIERVAQSASEMDRFVTLFDSIPNISDFTSDTNQIANHINELRALVPYLNRLLNLEAEAGNLLHSVDSVKATLERAYNHSGTTTKFYRSLAEGIQGTDLDYSFALYPNANGSALAEIYVKDSATTAVKVGEMLTKQYVQSLISSAIVP